MNGRPSSCRKRLAKRGLDDAQADFANHRWQVALIGKNLTNEFYVTGVVDGPSTGGASGGLVPAHADQLCFGTLPRTVQPQVTTKF